MNKTATTVRWVELDLNSSIYVLTAMDTNFEQESPQARNERRHLQLRKGDDRRKLRKSRHLKWKMKTRAWAKRIMMSTLKSKAS
jgi:hypothetical protein